MLIGFGGAGCCGAPLQQSNLTPTSGIWTAEQWTGDSSPYLKARGRIAQEVDASKDRLGTVAAYKYQAELRPLDPLAVFCWAAAALEASKYVESDADGDKCTAGVLEALAVPPSPRTYEYARMRYLFAIDGHWQSPNLKALGNRLLSVNSVDPAVLEFVAFSSGGSRGITLMDEAIKITPGDRALYCNLAYIYMDAFEYDNGPVAYGHMAVQDFRKYLSMSPRNKDSIKWALHYMEEVSSMLASGKRAYG